MDFNSLIQLKRERFDQLERDIADPGLFSNRQRAKTIMRERASIKQLLAKWDELDPKNYPDKASVVALLEKSFADSEAVLKSWPDAQFSKTVEPWLDVLEHSGEHYGLLVAYYRANGMVPPESRPKK